MRRPSHGLELKTVFLITKIHLLSLRGSRTIKKVPCDINPLTPVSDQDRISPYYIYTISHRQVMRIKKNINYGITN